MCKNFNEFVAGQAHEEEIHNSRVGGLGGSDAGILLRIGMNGLAGLNNTDLNRLAVMMGLAAAPNWGGNKYTKAGHEFEDEVATGKYFASHCKGIIDTEGGAPDYEREKVLEQRLAYTFRTFAHADFAFRGGKVVLECKYVQKSTDAAIAEYMPQLQWYYLLGVERVAIMHGWGDVEPFMVRDVQPCIIERNEVMIETLRQGIKTLDEAIQDGWRPEAHDKVTLEDAPLVVREAFRELGEAKAAAEVAKKRADEAVAVIKDYVEQFGIAGIAEVAEDGTKRTISYIAATATKTFDAAKFLAEHPEFDVPEYYKSSSRAASVTYKVSAPKSK